MTTTPPWFASAIEVVPEDCWVEVDGTRIHYLRWGPSDVPGIVFVHGGAAHAHWWSHIAPFFSESYAVAAIDLSGHGDSGQRDNYGLAGWVSEVVAVVDDMATSSPPIIVGHSMGGFVTLATAATACDRIGGAIIIDSPVREVDPEVAAARGGTEFGNPKVYPDVDTAAARFRTVPAQDHYLPYVMDRVARHSLRPVDGGVTWKFDRSVFGQERGRASEFLPHIACRVALLRAEHGLVTPEIGEYMYEQLGRVAPVIELPTAGHHPMLDVPLILVAALRSLVADWEHSHPLSR